MVYSWVIVRKDGAHVSRRETETVWWWCLLKAETSEKSHVTETSTLQELAAEYTCVRIFSWLFVFVCRVQSNDCKQTNKQTNKKPENQWNENLSFPGVSEISWQERSEKKLFPDLGYKEENYFIQLMGNMVIKLRFLLFLKWIFYKMVIETQNIFEEGVPKGIPTFLKCLARIR